MTFLSKALAAIPYCILKIFEYVLKRLSADRASYVMSLIGGCLASCIPVVSKRVRQNLALAFPSWSKDQRNDISRKVFQHWGRLLGEYPHIQELSQNPERLIIEGAEYLDILKKNPSQSAIFFSAHLGCTELVDAALQRCGIVSHHVYRQRRNPWLETFFLKYQRILSPNLIQEGAAFEMTQILKSGGKLVVLADHHNAGMFIPFFGRLAKMGKMIPRLATMTQCLVFPARGIRLKGFSYKVKFEPPLILPEVAIPKFEAIEQTLTQMSYVIEGWIKENPEQYWWFNRRWPRADYEKT